MTEKEKQLKDAMALLDEFPELKEIENGVMFECGAADGVYYSVCKYFEDNYKYKCINVECNPNVWEDLKRNRPNSINIQGALSNKSGEQLTFMVPTNDHENRGLKTGNASLHVLPVHWKGLQIAKFPVTTVTMMDILDKHSVDKINLMALDVEGHEKNILETLPKWHVKPERFCIEFVLFPGGRNGLTKLMSNMGYNFKRRNGHNLFFSRV